MIFKWLKARAELKMTARLAREERMIRRFVDALAVPTDFAARLQDAQDRAFNAEAELWSNNQLALCVQSLQQRAAASGYDTLPVPTLVRKILFDLVQLDLGRAMVCDALDSTEAPTHPPMKEAS